MKVRSGNYTLVSNIEMALTKYYGHGLNQDLDENHLILSYPRSRGKLKGFELNTQTNCFYKDIKISALDNAFRVTTKALYLGHEFEVVPFFGNDTHVHLSTRDEKIGDEPDFHNLLDSFGLSYYLAEIKITDVDKFWEERTLSDYNLPLPAGLEKRKEIIW